MFACIHMPGAPDSSLLDCAGAFSPLAENTAPGTVVLSVNGLAHLFRSALELANAIAQHAAELGMPEANVAIASNPDAALHVARGFRGVTVIAPGSEAARLSPLPLDVLALPPGMGETLAMWGIRTFGDFAALPETGIAERLGPEGVRFQALARGAGTRPLVPANPPPDFEESMELEYPVDLLEPLSFILGRLLGQLCGKLESRGLATHELRLRLALEDRTEHARTLRLPFPMRDSRTFLKLLQLDLDSHPPQAAIVCVSIAAEPINPRVVQHGLFIPLAPEPQKLELTLARIANLVGEGNVGSPEILDTHRPGAFRVARFGAVKFQTSPAPYKRLALRVFRPPLAATVTARSGHPSRVTARGVQGNVLSFAGPWRSSGEWWAPDAWSRDEWDVALSNGALYRIFFDRMADAWFVEGSYD